MEKEGCMGFKEVYMHLGYVTDCECDDRNVSKMGS